MTAGIIAGITWAIETTILGIALNMAPFLSTEQAVFLAPFVSTFLHDFFSALWAALYNGVKGNLKNVANAAWAIVIAVVFLRDTTLLTFQTIGCALLVILCGILAAADIKSLFRTDNQQ